MTNTSRPGVEDLLRELQGEQGGDEQSPEYAESSPLLKKRFSEMSAAQKFSDSKPDDEIGLNAEPEDAATPMPPSPSKVFFALEEDLARPSKANLVSRVRDKLARLTDPLAHELHANDDAVANWPKKIQIGFMAQIKKKDLLFHIGEWVADNASSKSSCFYQIIPYSGGFAYEIQEGGSGRGVLKSALESLSRHSEVIIPSSERFLQISIKQPGFSSYLLDEDDRRPPSPDLIFKDQLKPVFSRHHGLMVSGVLSALLGLATIGSAWFMVYTVYNKDKVPVYAKARYELPSDQLRKVNDVLNQSDSYLERLEYKGDRWNLVVKKSSASQAPAPAAATPAVATTTANAAADPALTEIQKSITEAGK